MNIVRRIVRYAGYAVLVVFALATLGALISGIPVLGSVGPLLLSPFGSWILILSLIGAVLSALRWRRTRGRAPLVMAILGAFAVLGTGVVEARQIAVARANGIPIALGRTLWLGDTSNGGAPVLRVYGTNGQQPLHALVYRATAAPGGAPARILVYVHGGGWGAGTVHDREGDMRWFADRGYLVVSVEYTLSRESVHPWNVAEGQVGCALAWIGANAAQFGGNPARLALFGESAGGNLVVNVAYKAAAGTLQPSCPGTMPRIAAVIAPYPVLDAVRMYHNDDLIAGKFAPMMTTRYTGGTPAQFADRYVAISSPNAINRAAPPTLLFSGLSDHLLPPAAAFDFAAKAKAVGVDIRVIAVPHAEHSFDQTGGSIGSQIVRGGTVQFLARHGLTPNP